MVSRDEKAQSIASRLRGKRAEKDESQEVAARGIGASTSTLSAWENGGGLKFADAWAAADYYGCSLDDLAGRPWPPADAKTAE